MACLVGFRGWGLNGKTVVKMKTYVITVSEFFPKSHPRAGEPTGFVEAIKGGNKLHTIRSNVDLWMKRIKNVQKGEAIISIRTWTGKPYRSKQKEVLAVVNLDGVGFEIVAPSDDFVAKVFNLDKPYFEKVSYNKLAENDGLSRQNFDAWFDGWQISEEKIIIHFTDFRYAFKCGEGENRCNCTKQENCGYIEMGNKLKELINH